jgi:hypothetical protein
MMTPMAGGRCRSAHDLISLSQNKRAHRLPPGSTGRSSPKPATRRPGFRRRTAHRSLRNGGMGASRAADTPDTRSPSACRARLGRQPGSGLLYFLPLGRCEKIGGEPHPLTLPVSQSFSTRWQEPFVPIFNQYTVIDLWLNGRNDEAIAIFKALPPTFFFPGFFLSQVYASMGGTAKPPMLCGTFVRGFFFPEW